jgi:opacity protein-like surface antigen
MTRRIVALALALALLPSAAARAERTAVLVLSIPAYILTVAGIATGCIYDVEEDVGEGYARDGWYLGLGGTAAIEDMGSSMAAQNGWGGSARAGYRCHPNVSVEGQAEGFTFDLDVDDPNYGFNVTGFDVTANGKLYLPLLGERLQPFFLSGFGALHDGEDTDIVMRLGGGVDYYLTQNIAVSLDMSYMSPHGQVSDLNFWSMGFGLQYRF